VTVHSIALFIAAALAEIGGAYLVWVGIKGAQRHRLRRARRDGLFAR
jgi:drug/metabolite transporter superfamily protein YnfA